MAHFKCLACTTRLYSTDSEADPIGDLCPVCGSLLEPIGELDEIVGVQRCSLVALPVGRRSRELAALPARPPVPRVPRAIDGVGAGRYRRGPRSQRRVRISPWSVGHGPAWARLSGAG